MSKVLIFIHTCEKCRRKSSSIDLSCFVSVVRSFLSWTWQFLCSEVCRSPHFHFAFLFRSTSFPHPTSSKALSFAFHWNHISKSKLSVQCFSIWAFLFSLLRCERTELKERLKCKRQRDFELIREDESWSDNMIRKVLADSRSSQACEFHLETFQRIYVLLKSGVMFRERVRQISAHVHFNDIDMLPFRFVTNKIFHHLVKLNTFCICRSTNYHCTWLYSIKCS